MSLIGSAFLTKRKKGVESFRSSSWAGTDEEALMFRISDLSVIASAEIKITTANYVITGSSLLDSIDSHRRRHGVQWFDQRRIALH